MRSPVTASHGAGARDVPAPGLRWGDYPERRSDEPRRDEILPARLGRYRRGLALARAEAAGWAQQRAEDFEQGREAVRAELLRDGLGAASVARCCGYVVDAARRALGVSAYDGQILAALAMLDNRLAEMATGEGKSLAAALAAAVGALAGMPVHVLTANDYLVARDAQAFRPLYQQLGLDVAPVLAAHDAAQRRAAYAQAVVYVTASELVFDYLRDRLFHGTARPALQRRARALAAGAEPPLLRGLCMAVIDEADSILIDEAQTPLVLSRRGDDAGARAFLWQAYALSGRLDAAEHFRMPAGERRVELTEAGRRRIAQLAERLHPVWKNAQHREDTIVAALTARHVLVRERDYVVGPAPASGAGGARDGGQDRVRIVDSVSGRIAEGRVWSRGLHALVAIKEGLRIEGETETLAQISFQRFFRRYHRCGGMSGTLSEARGELRALYGLRIVRIPLRCPSRRLTFPTRLYADDAARWPAVVERVRALCAAGRPVLIGTDSVADSLALSRRLDEGGIGHALLNARHDQAEAAIVAGAGRAGQVTVSTNMAGRGTDIHLDEAARAAGGLHVLCCQHNASRRHDRQLAGRAARQGEPGSSEAWLSLADPCFSRTGLVRGLRRLLLGLSPRGRVPGPPAAFDALRRVMQHAEEGRAARRRALVCRQEQAAERGLAFAAPE